MTSNLSKFKHPNATHSESGWVNSEVMRCWFEDVLLPYTDSRLSVLLLDMFSAHLSRPFLQLCRKNNIHVIFVPPGTTSLHQPNDHRLNYILKLHAMMTWRRSVLDGNSTLPTFATLLPILTASVGEVPSHVSNLTPMSGQEF